MRFQTVILIAALFTLASAGWAFAGAIEVYPVREVVPGLVGNGYTVVQGDVIESFPVEILGVLENAGPAGDLVLIRVQGDVMERTGGIAAGMSGSPVYVDGRLLGGIGYGFDMADHRIGLVTPAEDMLEVLALARAGAERREGGAPELSQRPPLPMAGVVIAPDPISAASARSIVEDDVWVASPIATPLAVSGLGPRAMGRLRSLVEGLGFVPVTGGSSSDLTAVEEESNELLPGSALGVQLMRGDASVGAIGTVTHVEDGAFVAFGHPFFSKGDVSYFASRAQVLTTVTSISVPFKLANSGAALGAITQDRSAGVGGVIGVLPETVRLSARVKDQDREKQTQFQVAAVQDELLTVPLLVIGALEALDRGIDRIGEGTGWVEFTIYGDGLPDPLVRSNMVYSQFDVAAESLVEAYEALLLLSENEFQDPELRAVEIDVRIEQGRRTASVVKATPHSETVFPGQQVLVDVALRPYRENTFTITVPLDIPDWVAPGQTTVSVQGGGFGFGGLLPEGLDPSFQIGWEDDEEEMDRTRAESLDKIVEDFVTRPRNNDLVLEFYPPYGSTAASSPDVAESAEPDEHEHGEPSAYAWSEASADAFVDIADPVRVTHALEYVVLGDAFFSLEIKAPDETLDEAPAESPAESLEDAPDRALREEPPRTYDHLPFER